ncbi:hypothetical protein LTS07_008521 [Exophiala sideris]|uniref:Uncharacterized protein n=1 Tax=Exophiala sideris TaxID=1016849 RepID=A0ABR0J3P4_9EURO|nr:hypothetical protein LTS07_008521 [Exophiala sideris]KAK5030768.1 hypothetical protein LTR13_008122 [Exophiala sideris]KAK5054309.1 hypothetical protein LTR69_008924 [Exophiala sideris]KAK5179711.1 hypothetical protein LTR44_007879 [Eurotiomycetes sp. CCFEE 6388]
MAGKEGEEEARKALPNLSAWAASGESRQAVFHAGQVLRAAKQHHVGTLQDVQQTSIPDGTTTDMPDPIWLDGDNSHELQSFLVLGKGSPCIQRCYNEESGSGVHLEAPLSDPVAIMRSITTLLQQKSADEEKDCPPLVGNLSKLMRSLGNAAAAMRRR